MLGPLEVSVTAEFPPADAVWNTATQYRVECKYPKNIDFIISGGHGDVAAGAKWIGPDGWVRVDRGVFEASNTQWIRDIQKLD